MRTSGCTERGHHANIPLPENPSLEHLKKQAKLVQNLVQGGDAGGLDLVAEFHPRLAVGADVSGFRRSDAQLVVARLYGFASWTQLRDHLAVVDRLGRHDHASDDPGDLFVATACLTYEAVDPNDEIVRAHAMLERDPSLAISSIAALATVGDHQRLRDLLDADPAASEERRGPHGWPPILCCAYSRISTDNPSWSSTACAEALLEAGEEANSGFLWHGLVPPFTALTGALGGGECDEPPHPDRDKLARLLLEAGADPNDGQGLYNNGLAGTAIDDPSHLILVHNYGLGTDGNGPWYHRLGATS